MHEITDIYDLNSDDFLIEVRAPLVAQKFKAGQFVLLLLQLKGERIPLSVFKVESDRVSLLIKKLGKTSLELYNLKIGDTIEAVIGPLGNAIDIKQYGNVVVASDLVCGHAENYAISKALHAVKGNNVISMQTFPGIDPIYLEKELKAVCDEYHITTEDGSYGVEGHYLAVLEEMLQKNKVDMIFAGGDMPHLKKLAKVVKLYNIPTMVTLRSIMLDATGMCGSCRVFIDGIMKLACIDGPMFDAHKIDFDQVINSMNRFKSKELEAVEHYKKVLDNE